MSEIKREEIKKVVLNYLADGKKRKIEEIRVEVQRCGIVLEEESSILRTTLFHMKKENTELINPERGVYQLETVHEMNSSEKTESKYDLSDFETIHECAQKQKKLVVSIGADGMVSLSSGLQKYFPKQKAVVKIKNDCSELILLKREEECINLGKNGRIKNYEILKRIQNRKIVLPAYYVGEWDEEEQLWLGKRVKKNPNQKKEKTE